MSIARCSGLLTVRQRRRCTRSLAFAIELEKTNIKVNIACPGFTATDLNDFHGTRAVEQGAHEAVRLALLGPDGPTGAFSDEDGPVPW